MPEQETVARAQRDAREGGGSGPGHLYYQKVTTMWGALRVQVYGFLQTTLDTHGAERHAMWHGQEDVDSIRSRVPVDTLQDKQIPVIVKGPIGRVG